MGHRYLKVNPQLNNYIRSVLVLDNCSDDEGSDLPLFTGGVPALVLRSTDNKHHVTFFGQSVPDEQWVLHSGTVVIAFLFHPFVLGTIFKLSAKTLKATPVTLDLWNAQKAMALSVQLFHANATAQKLDILDHFILSHINANRRDCDIIQYATDKLMQDPNTELLSQLLQELNLTERTFQRIFKKYVGIAPNEYRRICQFYFAFSQLKGGHFDKLTDVVYDNGFFDQSHYIRSFKTFTDTTPKEYLQSGLPKRSG